MTGKSSSRLLTEFPALRKRFWGRHVWARGYFCRSSGNVTDDVIRAYIEQQAHESDDVFRIEGENTSSGEAPAPSACLSGYALGFSRKRRL